MKTYDPESDIFSFNDYKHPWQFYKYRQKLEFHNEIGGVIFDEKVTPLAVNVENGNVLIFIESNSYCLTVLQKISDHFSLDSQYENIFHFLQSNVANHN